MVRNGKKNINEMIANFKKASSEKSKEVNKRNTYKLDKSRRKKDEQRKAESRRGYN